jgi:multiple sugar transport system ATP-binding protein
MGEVILKDVWKKYDQVEAVKGLSFEVREGQCVVILGSSGAGKTSTLKMIAGLEEVSAGEIHIDGRLANYLEPHERNIAMTFETYALYPHMNVYENLAFPLRSPRHRRPEAEIKERVTKVAKLLGIDMLLDRMPGQLSQGQKQRTGLGRTLVREPSVFLFDEPLSHLDAKLRNRMRTEIKRIQEELKTTSIFVTHDYLEALSLGDQIVVLNQGVRQQVGTPVEIFDRPANLFVANLVGDPPVNVLDAKVVARDGGMGFYLEGGGCEVGMLPSMAEQLVGYKDKGVKLGIRPMHLIPYLAEEPTCQIKGKVYSWERIETKGVLSVNVGELTVHAETPGTFQFTPDQPVWLSVDLEEVRVFDPETSKVIAPYTV